MILPNSKEFVSAAKLTWQQHMKLAIRTAEELAERLDLPLGSICREQAAGSFPLFVPVPYLQRMEVGNPNDPLLKQILPIAQENTLATGSADPVGESQFALTPNLLQKYQGRALMIVNGTCAVHCRYCFRRHFPYSEVRPAQEGWGAALKTLATDSTICEVIWSGGDPLTVVDDSLAGLIGEIEQIPHVSRIRIHTRLPIVIPQRVTDRWLRAMNGSRLDFVVVVHCNHPNEIDDSVAESLGKLKSSVSTLLNQAVLLRGVNDNVETLCALSERLIASGVVPYYLHQLDPVAGAMHFEVPVSRGVELIEQCRQRLPGYLVPRYVREIPGRPNKTILA